MGQCWRATSPLDDGDIRASVYRVSAILLHGDNHILRRRAMKQHLSAAIALITVTVSLQSVASASGWSRGLTVTSLEENNVGGEVVKLTVGEIVDNSGHCTNATGYAIRDSVTLRGSLALLTSALIAGKTVDLFVTGTCDATGMPNVIGVILH
jgi:hypothetical protein